MFWELFTNKLERIYLDSLKLKRLEHCPVSLHCSTAWNIFLDLSMLKTNVKQLSMTV